MLSAAARAWPGAGVFVLQPKFDGFRVLIQRDGGGRVRFWSRHGTALTAGVGDLCDVARDTIPPGTIVDGELIALSETEQGVAQDFAAVGRAVFGRRAVDRSRLHVVAFDLLELDGEDLRAQSWRARDTHLRELLAGSSGRLQAIDTLDATPATHDSVVALGYEGTVLKQPRSLYRPGRQSTWRKLKARRQVDGEVVALSRGEDGRRYAAVEVGDDRVVAAVVGRGDPRRGEVATVTYSRRDADGSLREPRVGG